MADAHTEARSLLEDFPPPLRTVENGVPAYGLSLGVGGQYGAANAQRGRGVTGYALAFAVGMIAGSLLTVRAGRRF
jgi:hypothetical protein